MAFKQFQLDETTAVTVYKRTGSRSLRLSVTGDGKIRVTIPTWSPYQAGLQFAKLRLDWIKRQQQPSGLLVAGQPIGKAHHLRFAPQATGKRVSSRVMAGEIVIGFPSTMQASNPTVQTVARTACIRALRKQAEQLLPQRLKQLATEHGFEYQSVNIKQLKSRWGSCDQTHNIVLNLFLMQLPWQNIDYVLIHELVHTRHLNHSTQFWETFERVLPHARAFRKQMRRYQPTVQVLADIQNDTNTL